VSIKLVTPPTATETRRLELLAKMRQLVTEVEQGDVTEFFAVLRHPNGEWSSINSGSTNMPDLVGRLEIAKWKAVKTYLEN
jgi:hypothetical protein